MIKKKCSYRPTFSGASEIPPCGVLAAAESMYCATHRAEAMARVAGVRDDRPRPWFEYRTQPRKLADPTLGG